MRFSLILPLAVFSFAGRLFAAQEGAGGYLEYQEPAVTGGASATSTGLYIISLLFVFVAVILLAYFTSKFIGGRFARLGAGGSLFHSIPLDHNKRIVFFELNGSVLVLGVTEHNISLLKEISDPEQIRGIKEDLPGKGKNGILRYQSGALLDLEKKIKPILRNLPGGKKGDSQ